MDFTPAELDFSTCWACKNSWANCQCGLDLDIGPVDTSAWPSQPAGGYDSANQFLAAGPVYVQPSHLQLDGENHTADLNLGDSLPDQLIEFGLDPSEANGENEGPVRPTEGPLMGNNAAVAEEQAAQEAELRLLLDPVIHFNAAMGWDLPENAAQAAPAPMPAARPAAAEPKKRGRPPGSKNSGPRKRPGQKAEERALAIEQGAIRKPGRPKGKGDSKRRVRAGESSNYEAAKRYREKRKAEGKK
jgi:hypothetical protein